MTLNRQRFCPNLYCPPNHRQTGISDGGHAKAPSNLRQRQRDTTYNLIDSANDGGSIEHRAKPKANIFWVFVLQAVLVFVVGCLMSWIGHRHTGVVLRWLAIGAFAIFAGRRRTLTPWVFFAMVAGSELGVDAPSFAIHLRVFSDIFLRLIKTIVAPLIFAALVTGLTGHGQLKSIGRMGIKSLVYFEVLTTLALVIGLVAINLSK